MRPSRDQWAMALAVVTAQRSTCLRRKVGAVGLNARGHVLATGYNGVAAGVSHCNEWSPAQVSYPHSCSGALAPSGTQLDACEAVHAEQNLLLQCHDVWELDTVYVTTSPCVTCTKLLLNTGCQRVVFLEEYPQPAARELWLRSGRAWEQFQGDFQWIKDLP